MSTNVEQLVEKYITTHAEAEARRQAQVKIELLAAEYEFLDLCRVWIGGLWDVLQPGTVKVSTDSSYGPRFWLPVSFEGVEGLLFFATSSFFDRPYLKFRDLKKIELKQKDNKAVPISDEEWGRMFADVRAQVVEDQARAERKAQEDREWDIRLYENRINFSTTILAEFIQGENEVRRETEEREQEEREYAEHKRAMQERAAAVWFPFTVWKISFVARTPKIESDEEPFYVDEAYCLEPEPNAEGWWKTTYRGEIRLSRFPNLLRLDEIAITDPEMAEAKRVCVGEWEYGVQVRIPPQGAVRIQSADVPIVLVEA